MDRMLISSNMIRSLLGKLARRVICKKLGKNVLVSFPGDIDICTEEDGKVINARLLIDVTMRTDELFSLIARED